MPLQPRNAQRRADERPPTLFSYTIPIDDGAAPNPFRGLCTLAICKPAIRRVAKEGDWVVGLGSKRRGLAGKIVYAMKVKEVISLEEYDKRARTKWKFRIPDITSPNLIDRLGDCIYKYSDGKLVKQRDGVHGKINKKTDLSGKNVLISEHYFYFGSNARKLPSNLMSLCHQTQGHKSVSNASLLEPFVKWIEGKFEVGQHGWPDYIVKWKQQRRCGCAPRQRDNEKDEVVNKSC